jgi:hypothetical protein
LCFRMKKVVCTSVFSIVLEGNGGLEVIFFMRKRKMCGIGIDFCL